MPLFQFLTERAIPFTLGTALFKSKGNDMNPGETVAITFSADPLKIIGVGRVRVEDKLEGFVEINIHESIEFLHKGVAHFERMENPDDSIEYLYLPSSARSYLVDRFLRPTFRIGGWVEEKVETCNHAQQASLF